jgi:hypothetical protein
MNELVIYGADDYQANALGELLRLIIDAEHRQGRVSNFVVAEPMLRFRKISRLPAVLDDHDQVICQGEVPSFELMRTWIATMPRSSHGDPADRPSHTPWEVYASASLAVAALADRYRRLDDSAKQFEAAVLANYRLYFPKGALADNLARWYSRELTIMGEPPLWSPDTPGQSKHEVYRFLWLRSFHPHVAIRAEKDSDGARIVLIVPQGGGYGIGGSWSKKSRNVADYDWAELVQKIDLGPFWLLPSSGGECGFDGAEWILEVARPNCYHVVARWSGGEIKGICNSLLRLCGADLGPMY